MVINDFHVFGAAREPSEAEPPLPVDADAVLALPVAFQRLEAIARLNPQVVEPAGDFELPKLAACDPGAALESAHAVAARQGFSLRASK
jgi:hypothetical protein